MPSISLSDPENGTTADATVISNNNATLEGLLNGGVDNTNISPTADIAVSKLAPGAAGQVLATDGITVAWGTGFPSGVMLDYAGNTAPSGWLLADGTAVSRTTYADLFTAIGTLHGAGDGSTTFNLPDARGRATVGKGTHTDVDTVGETDGLAIGSRRPKHATSISTNPTISISAGTIVGPTGGFALVSPGGFGSGSSGFDLQAISVTQNPSYVASGGAYGPTSAAPTDTPAYLVVNKIIKT